MRAFQRSPRTIPSLEYTRQCGNALTTACFGAAYNAGWYHELTSDKRKKHNIGERLMLIVTEVAEAMEGHRKNLPSDHLPGRSMFEEELADAVIRIFDTAGACDIRLGDIIAEKLAYNAKREDHTHEHRMSENGKKV